MINQELYARNEALIRKRLGSQIDHSLEKGNKYIDQELSGPLNLLIREAVKFFYNAVKKPDMADGTRNQINVIINSAKESIEHPEKKLEDIITAHYSDFLKGDQTTRALKKTHKNYKWCVENQKKVFYAQLEPLIPMLLCESLNVDSYLDLTRETYKTKDKIMEAMTKQKPLMEAALRKIAEDKSILDLPMGRDILFNVLKGGYNETWEELEAEVNSMNID
jgi:hypothetical protein